MAASLRMKRRILATIAVLGVLLLVLNGCRFRPTPLAASTYSDEQGEVVEVTIRASDARTIQRRQLYFSLKIINCSGTIDGYPAHPSIGGKPVPGFDFPIDGDTVLITGKVPTRIFEQYPQPCVFLEGGGYFTGTIKSKIVPVVRGPRKAPNNSPKPTLLLGPA